MIDFREFINEGFKNLIGQDSDKQKYVNEVWDLIQDSYRPINGIHGSGFKNKQDMIDHIDFWKLFIDSNQSLKAVAMYKKDESNKRKLVAYASDGSPEGKQKVTEMIIQDISRSYAELSGATLNILLKNIKWEDVKKYIASPVKASKLLNKDVTAINDLQDIPEDAQLMLSKFPKLKDYGYIREIGGVQHFKVMFGKY